MADIQEMARQCFGYGCWDAPYWFIGPEQGQGRHENNDLTNRLDAWCHLGVDGLSDCRAFHEHLNERAEPKQRTKWYREHRPPLQSTWRPMMLLLMTFLNRPADLESLRIYQRKQWGRLNGETCVIELSGLPANNLSVSRDRESFRQERIEKILDKMRTCKPKLVVMYGKDKMEHWEKIGGRLPPDNILKYESSIIAFVQSPRGTTNQYWIEWGKRLREESGRS